MKRRDLSVVLFFAGFSMFLWSVFFEGVVKNELLIRALDWAVGMGLVLANCGSLGFLYYQIQEKKQKRKKAVSKGEAKG